MPEDLGGRPFPDGEGPDEEHDTAADDAFAAVVLDEEFVRSAEVHEPTAEERMLAAAQSHAETEVPLPQDDGYVYGPPSEGDFGGTTGGYGFGFEPGGGAFPGRDGADEPYGDDDYDLDDERYGTPIGPRPYRGHVRWQRPVALVLAIVMGVGVVALAFSALYRGSAGQRSEPAPPHSTSGTDVPGGGGVGTGPRSAGTGGNDAPAVPYRGSSTG